MEEYTALRTELVHIQASVRTLWASVFGLFVTAVGILFAAILKDDNTLEKFANNGVLNWASGMLISILSLGMFLAYRWTQQSFYIGSYIVVAYEEHNPQLRWHSRNRRASEQSDSPLHNYAISIAHSFANSSLLLLVSSLCLFVFGILWSPHKLSYIFLDFPYNGGVYFVLIMTGIGSYRYCKLKNVTKERKEMEKDWRCELNRNR